MIARINGHCLAGGMGFLAMCDMAVAAEHASFGLPEVKIGLFPAQVLAVLPHGTGTVKVFEGGLEIDNEAGTDKTVIAQAAAIVRLDL